MKILTPNKQSHKYCIYICIHIFIYMYMQANTGCISKCYQGPNLTPFTSMLNKLGYIKLYISKTQIYLSFSEVPCHVNQCKLPFIYRTVRNHLTIFSVYWSTLQNQLTLLSFLTDIYHSYIEHFEHIESNQHFTVSLSSVGAVVSIIPINRLAVLLTKSF